MQIRVRYARISTSYNISAASNVYEKTNRERNSDYGQSSDFYRGRLWKNDGGTRGSVDCCRIRQTCSSDSVFEGEEAQNIRNGICFARKVLTTGQCDLLVLDEVLGLVDCGIVQEQELRELIFLRGADTDVTLTGIRMCDSLLGIADHVSDIEQIK